MKICEMTEKVYSTLCSANITDKAEAEWLVALALNIRRSEVYSCQKLSSAQKNKVERYLEKRKQHIPLAYIVKNAEFYGYTFKVNKNVLIPRPETEELVSLVLKDVKAGDRVLDIGTGSGAIAISVAKNSETEVVAVDILKKALAVAKQNAKNLDARVKFIYSDMFSNLKNMMFDKIVSNPPYISEAEYKTLESEVKDFEPKTALVAEDDGLYFYKQIIENAKNHLSKNGNLYFEIGNKQAKQICKLLEKDYKDILVFKDLEKNDRMIKATLK